MSAKKLREWLKHARKRLWAAMSRRHNAEPGSAERKDAAEEVVRRRKVKDRIIEKLEDKQKPPTRGIRTVDGKPVAAWIAHYVLKAREEGLWDGYVVSGYRSPEYSEQICYQMCGAPSCPGRCAGRSSEHSQQIKPRGAVDVDLAHRDQFARAMQRLGAPLRNALPNDPNHFSASGH
jgi:hypothetical protein